MLLVCEPGMKSRHWQEIKATTKLEFSVTPGMNMMQLMDIGLNHYVHLIEDTCVAASKEAALEKALTKMEGNWSDAEFGTKEWRTGRILAGIDEIQQELDDQIVKTQVWSRRPVVWRRLHFIQTTRVHRTMPWVVSLSISGPFRDRDAPRRPCTALATSSPSYLE